MRVLVLGGTSYIAQFLLEKYLLDVKKHAIQNVELACTIKQAVMDLALNQIPGIINLQIYDLINLGDVNGIMEVIQDFQADVIINCAALSSPADVEKDPEKAMHLNYEQPRKLIEAIQEVSLKPIRFIQFSTDFVYRGDEALSSGYSESIAPDYPPPSTAYGRAKLRFDEYITDEMPDKSHVQAIVLRLANVIGPAAPLVIDSRPKFMEWLHNSLFQSDEEEKSKPIRLWEDEYRSFVYVYDVIDIVFRLMLADSLPANNSVINIGGEKCLSRVQLANGYLDQAPNTNKEQASAVVPAKLKEAELAYDPPLSTPLDTSLLSTLLPDFQFTATASALRQIYESFQSKE